MSVVHSIVLVFIVTGGWSVVACAPPTPKVQPSIVPQVIEREPIAPVRDSEKLFRPAV